MWMVEDRSDSWEMTTNIPTGGMFISVGCHQLVTYPPDITISEDSAMGKYRILVLNTALFAVNAVATKLISFFLVPLYTAYMSAGEYGVTDMALTVISLATPLLTLDISEAAVRHIVSDRENGAQYTAISFLFTIVSIIIIIVLSPFLTLGIFGGLGDYKGWFILAYATSALMNWCGQVARGFGDVKIIPICAIVSSVVTLVSALILIGNMGMKVTGYFVSVSLGPILSIVVYLIYGKLATIIITGTRKLICGGKTVVKETLSPMLRYSLPLIPNGLFWWAGTSINRFFITGLLGIGASGMFAAAGKIPNLLNTAYSVFQSAWQLSAFQESKRKNLNTFFTQVFTLVQAGMTILCALLSFIAPWLAAILLQGETYAAWPMIPTLLIANLMNVFNSFYGTVYSTTMHTAYIMKTTVFGALSCIVFTPLLIPFVGVYGACIASVIGQGIVFIMRAFDSRRYIPFDAGWRFLIPTLIMLAVQAIATALQTSYWHIISLVCCIIICIFQGHRLTSIIMTKLMRNHK